MPALADPKHPDRTDPAAAIADLLWFPTGGGKTEAYLGAGRVRDGDAAAAGRRSDGSIRRARRRRDMRYTLRLLTIQQFQRASTLLCAMEIIRREALPGDALGRDAVPHRAVGRTAARRPNTTDRRLRAASRATRAAMAATRELASPAPARRTVRGAGARSSLRAMCIVETMRSRSSAER